MRDQGGERESGGRLYFKVIDLICSKANTLAITLKKK
jgi:hypothetical protein